MCSPTSAVASLVSLWSLGPCLALSDVFCFQPAPEVVSDLGHLCGHQCPCWASPLPSLEQSGHLPTRTSCPPSRHTSPLPPLAAWLCSRYWGIFPLLGSWSFLICAEGLSGQLYLPEFCIWRGYCYISFVCWTQNMVVLGPNFVCAKNYIYTTHKQGAIQPIFILAKPSIPQNTNGIESFLSICPHACNYVWLNLMWFQ